MTRGLRGRGLYVITPGAIPDLLDRTAAALNGGAVVVQYRDKTGDASRRLHEACALRSLCAEHGVRLIVNDDIELAARCGADGVHLGEDDASVTVARLRLGADATIGVSCYDNPERARRMAARGADYLAFGAFHPSPTKPWARRADPGLLRDARALGLPLVAIGGITPDNGRPLVHAGADFLAVISGVYAAADSEAAARRYADLFDHQDD